MAKTTQSDRLRMDFAITSLILSTLMASALARAQASAPHLQQAILANSLDHKGKLPFHLKMSFEYYDLRGNVSDVGILEEWWGGPGISRLTITSSSLKTPEPVLLDGAIKLDPRERYFLYRMLGVELHPIPSFKISGPISIREDSQTFDKVRLTCFTGVGDEEDTVGKPPSVFCVDPATSGLRFERLGKVFAIARNRLGSFHDTTVSMDVQIANGDLMVISGKVIALQTFDPATSDIALLKPYEPDSQNNSTDRSQFIMGKILNKVPPSYPLMARISHVGGTVVLDAIITKTGTISNLFLLASASEMLDNSAIDAVKRWTYQPSTLDGQPTEVSTTIYVNFIYQ